MSFSRVHLELEESLQNEIRNWNAVKWYMAMEVSLERQTDDGIEMIDTYFRNETTTELTAGNTAQRLIEGYEKVKKSVEEFLQGGSGWLL